MKWISFFILSILFFTGLLSQVNIPNTLPTDPINEHIVTPSNQHWIEWDSPEGLLRQERSQAKANLMQLLRFYESQIRPTYCGVATAVVALNALAVEAPSSTYFGKYRIFTQEEFFNGKIGTTVDKAAVDKAGLALKDMARIMKVHPLKVSTYQAQYCTDDEIRTTIISALNHRSQCVLVLYQRKELIQEGGGHWSPIAAYDAESDSFLLLDVARYKYPPAWISAEALIASMRTFDDASRSRGFLILDNAVK